MIYVFLADGFEEIEALAPVDILRRAGLAVKTVAIGKDKTVYSTRKVPVMADILVDDVKLEDIEMIVLPGGQPGADNLYASEKLLKIVQYAYDNGKYMAALCAAPLVFGRMGLLTGKKAVCYPGYEHNLKGAEAQPEKALVCDGKIITGRGPGAATEFAFKLVEILTDKDKADSIRKAMLF